MFSYAPRPLYCCVVIEASRTSENIDGAYAEHVVPDAQIRLAGTSGYWVATVLLDVDSAPQVEATQRGAAVKTTLSGTVPYAPPFRNP